MEQHAFRANEISIRNDEDKAEAEQARVIEGKVYEVHSSQPALDPLTKTLVFWKSEN